MTTSTNAPHGLESGGATLSQTSVPSCAATATRKSSASHIVEEDLLSADD